MNKGIRYKKIDKSIILISFIIIVALAKVVRYTVMKTVLVDESIGFSILKLISSGSCRLSFIWRTPGDLASYNTAWIFSPLYYLGVSTYIDYEIAITIIFNLILILLLRKTKKKLSISEGLLWILSIAVLNIFAFNLAKEPVQMLFFLILYLVLSGNLSDNQKFALSLFVLFFSVVTYRSYYILIVAFLVEIILFEKVVLRSKKIRIKHLVIFIGAIYLIYVAFIYASKDLFPTEYLELIRVRTRVGSEAMSEIAPIINSDNVILFCLNYPLCFIRMLVPIELLLSDIKYFPFIIFQFLITIKIVGTYFQFKNLSYERKLALNIILSFILASCAFEPDFGSWIRHEAVTFPVMLVAFGYMKNELRRKFKL